MGTDSAIIESTQGAARAASSDPREAGRAAVSVSPRVALFLRWTRLTDMTVAITALVGAFLLTNVGRMPGGFREFLAMRLTVKNVLLLIAFAGAWRLVCTLVGLYRWEIVKYRRIEVARVLVAATVGSSAALVFPAISVTGAFRFTTVIVSLAVTAAAMLLARSGLRGLVDLEADERHAFLIVGTGPRGLALARRLASSSSARLLGYVDAGEPSSATEVRERYLGDLRDLERILLAHMVDEVYVALPMRSRYAEIEAALQICERTGVPVKWLSDVFESARGRRFEMTANGDVVSITDEHDHGRLMMKRLIDVIGAAVGLVVLTPVIAAAALAIKATSRGPVLYVQDRYGLYRRRFQMYKLRTMVEDADALQGSLENRNEASGPVFKIKDDPRITPVGRFLRRTSIDEIPQLVNVLRGEMSLVGPRPLPLRDVDRFTEAALVRRFGVRPGLTCLWQISGRSELGFDRWIELDLQYIDEWSLGLDLKIILKTVPAVIMGAGAS
jgi:exopolysaccharide biosynthesis polyprenyl glycosylphosphotransferase